MMVTANIQIFQLIVLLFELAFHAVIVEDIIHGILNYTKLAFNSSKMILNDIVSQPMKRDDRPLSACIYVKG